MLQEGVAERPRPSCNHQSRAVIDGHELDCLSISIRTFSKSKRAECPVLLGSNLTHERRRLGQFVKAQQSRPAKVDDGKHDALRQEFE